MMMMNLLVLSLALMTGLKASEASIKAHPSSLVRSPSFYPFPEISDQEAIEVLQPGMLNCDLAEADEEDRVLGGSDLNFYRADHGPSCEAQRLDLEPEAYPRLSLEAQRQSVLDLDERSCKVCSKTTCVIL